MAPDQAQGPVHGARRCHLAESLGPLRPGGRGSQGCPRAPDARRAARSLGQGRSDADQARADARRNGRRPVRQPGLDVGAQARRLSGARHHRRARRQAALAARTRVGRHVPAARGGAWQAGRERHDPRRRDRGVRRERQAVLCGAPGSRPVEERAGDRGRRPQHASGLLRFRSAAFRGHRSAQVALPGPAALSRPVPAAFNAGQARARGRRRDRLAGRGTRQWLRGRDRQAQGEPLRGRPALVIVGEGQAHAQRGFRHRRLYPREGLAHRARRPPGRLLGPGHAALRLARRLRFR